MNEPIMTPITTKTRYPTKNNAIPPAITSMQKPYSTINENAMKYAE